MKHVLTCELRNEGKSKLYDVLFDNGEHHRFDIRDILKTFRNVEVRFDHLTLETIYIIDTKMDSIIEEVNPTARP